ncbi:hypothetical protein GCM10023194_24170 [Planotetraspora phitsanulokensis]|uniref:Glycosyltransferase RgtA/B/C/D-like domain-containing protein n=1 Tax=Planotetraspora phitsanulokensis TaxID=575192 RepID=A0A8J3U9H1_9ACTN|nr:hypothetical protein [Planotetraspora phitsanulokensis]GII38474.1 hypothetical protein Pph01_34770 [Planotetraspora phitsanulokensis]
MEYLIVAIAAAMLGVIVQTTFAPQMARRILPVLLVAFAVRIILHVLVMQADVIDYGGDDAAYMDLATKILARWEWEGFHYVTAEQLPGLYSVGAVCHLFAAIMYVCDGPAELACTAVVALISCALCVVIYKMATLVGADESAAFRLLVITAFMPSFVLHSSDTFKDGINAFLVVSCLGLGLSNLRRFDIRKVMLAGPLLWTLWQVRPYMVFMCAPPLLLSALSPKRILSLRSTAVLIGLLVTGLMVLVGTGDQLLTAPIQEELLHAQSTQVRMFSAGSGSSGVTFDDGGNAWGALAPKLLYTLLSPFPWTDGSLVLQLGKIETAIWYYLLWNAMIGARELWRRDRRLLLVLALFIVSGFIIYATTVANIGLIFRQRMPLMMITSLLAAVAWTRCRARKERPGFRSLPPFHEAVTDVDSHRDSDSVRSEGSPARFG